MPPRYASYFQRVFQKYSWENVKFTAHLKVICFKSAFRLPCSEKDAEIISQAYNRQLFDGPHTAPNSFLRRMISSEAQRLALDLVSLHQRIEDTLKKRLLLLNATSYTDKAQLNILNSEIDTIRSIELETRNKLLPLIIVELEFRTARFSVGLSLVAILIAVATYWYSVTSGKEQAKALDSSCRALMEVSETAKSQTQLLQREYNLMRREAVRAESIRLKPKPQQTP